MEHLLRYVNPQGPLPEVKGQGTLLVIGSAACVWEDLRHYDQQHGDQDRLAVNDMMAYYPGRLQYGATLHGEKLPGWTFGQYFLCAKGGWPPMQVHSHVHRDGIRYVWPLQREGGTSGIFAVMVGLLMGYERIVLAGVPCDASPRFFDPPWKLHAQFGMETVQQEWQRARDEVPMFRERVCSLSGQTKEWLGAPA